MVLLFLNVLIKTFLTMATNLTIWSFATSNKKGKKSIYVKVFIKGQSNSGVFIDVANRLQKFDLSEWDKKKQRFVGVNTGANNAVLDEIEKELTQLVEDTPNITPQQLKDYFVNGKEKCVLTVGEFCLQRKEDFVKLRTTNHEQYNTLYNNLCGVDVKNNTTFEKPMYNGVPIIDMDIKDVDNKCFKQFVNWVDTVKEGKGRRNLCGTFRALINYAFARGLTDNNITAKCIAERNIKARQFDKEEKQIPCLTPQQIETFKNLDVSLTRKNKSEYVLRCAELYKDACMLMYYILSRPIDTITLRYDTHVKKDEKGRYYLQYTPTKKAGYGGEVQQYLSEDALQIMRKYEGQSKGGYLLPFSQNEKYYDLNKISAEEWQKRMYRLESGIEGHINNWLKRVAPLIGVEPKDLKMYTFRHSAITHKIIEGDRIEYVAYNAGTSVNQINKHYFNKQSIRESYGNISKV